MKMNKKILISFLSCIISFLSFSEELLLKNTKIHTATERGTLENSDVLIRDGVILRIGKNLVSSRAIEKDLSGKAISPAS